MEATDDIMALGYEVKDLKDLNKEARQIYLQRVEHHILMTNVLKDHMIEVKEEEPEPVKEAPESEEDKGAEDENQQEEEKQEEDEKQQEQKELYDVDLVYRTTEKRLGKHPRNFIASSFGFKDKVG